MIVIENPNGSITPVFANEIQRGILFLNKAEPNWREKIDPAFLDLSEPHMCVCGQVFENHYTEGLARLSEYLDIAEVDDDVAAEYGFCVSVADCQTWVEKTGQPYEEACNFLFSALTEEWINVLKVEKQAKEIGERLIKRMADLVT